MTFEVGNQNDNLTETTTEEPDVIDDNHDEHVSTEENEIEKEGHREQLLWVSGSSMKNPMPKAVARIETANQVRRYESKAVRHQN